VLELVLLELPTVLDEVVLAWRVVEVDRRVVDVALRVVELDFDVLDVVDEDPDDDVPCSFLLTAATRRCRSAEEVMLLGPK
jgi:hypothetical protein